MGPNASNEAAGKIVRQITLLPSPGASTSPPRIGTAFEMPERSIVARPSSSIRMAKRYPAFSIGPST